MHKLDETPVLKELLERTDNFKDICSTYLLQPHHPHETISKNFIPRRSQIPNQVRPQEERSSHRSPEAAPAQYTF
jgi:hypothetical protein